MMGHAYLIPTMFALAVPAARWRLDVTLGAATVLGFCIIAMQENEATALKNTFDVQIMSRIVGRIEQVLPDRNSHALVVIGGTPFAYERRVLLHPERPFRPHLASPAFAAYRQADMANFFLGRPLLQHPTEAQVARAKAAAELVLPWPSGDSVFFLDDDIVVVVLDPPTTGTPTTWPR